MSWTGAVVLVGLTGCVLAARAYVLIRGVRRGNSAGNTCEAVPSQSPPSTTPSTTPY